MSSGHYKYQSTTETMTPTRLYCIEIYSSACFIMPARGSECTIRYKSNEHQVFGCSHKVFK